MIALYIGQFCVRVILVKKWGGGGIVPTPTFHKADVLFCFSVRYQTSLQTRTSGPRFQAPQLKIGSVPDILDIHCNMYAD